MPRSPYRPTLQQPFVWLWRLLSAKGYQTAACQLRLCAPEYDIGHRDVFLCLAVNLLELDDLKAVLKEANESTKGMDLNVKSDYMKDALNGCTKKRNIELKLRR